MAQVEAVSPGHPDSAAPTVAAMPDSHGKARFWTLALGAIGVVYGDIGISLPGTGETPAAPVFIDGRKAVTLRGPRIAGDFKTLVSDYIEKRYGSAGRNAAE